MNFFSTKYAALNQPIYKPIGNNADGITIKGFRLAAEANSAQGLTEGNDPGNGTHGYIDGRKQSILNEGERIQEGTKLNLFG